MNKSDKIKSYKGEVVYLFAFDVGYELNEIISNTFFGQKLTKYTLENSKRGPRTSFFKPQMINIPPLEKIVFGTRTNISICAKFLPMGVLSITAKVPFEVNHIDELSEYHDLKFCQFENLNDEIHSLAHHIFEELKSFIVKPVEKLSNEEAYTIFYINSNSFKTEKSTETWLSQHKKSVAAVLMEEKDADGLSDLEIEETIETPLSYYKNDLIIVDWDAALVVENPSYIEEILYIMELANIQLTELEAYDRILDNVIDNSYKDLGDRKHGHKNKMKVLENLKELRVDMARMNDEICNITKFFGDWHLAKVYKALSSRFHLAEWQKTIDEKLNILDKIYETLKTEKYNKTILYLEWAVVVCFIIDLVIIGMELFKK